MSRDKAGSDLIVDQMMMRQVNLAFAIIDEQKKKGEHQSTLTVTAQLFRVLEDRFGWREANFRSFYQNGNTEIAISQGWEPK